MDGKQAEAKMRMNTMQTAEVRDKLLRIWDYLDSIPIAEPDKDGCEDGYRDDISDACAFVEDAVNEVVGYAYF